MAITPRQIPHADVFGLPASKLIDAAEHRIDAELSLEPFEEGIGFRIPDSFTPDMTSTLAERYLAAGWSAYINNDQPSTFLHLYTSVEHMCLDVSI